MSLGYLLDTCVLSELVRPSPDPGLVEWIDAQVEETLHVSVLTLGEIQKGISKLPDSPKKIRLVTWLKSGLPDRFEGRILPITTAIAITWGTLQADSEAAGRPLPLIDPLLAATARIHDLTMVTRNTTHIQPTGVPVKNPWSA